MHSTVFNTYVGLSFRICNITMSSRQKLTGAYVTLQQ